MSLTPQVGGTDAPRVRRGAPSDPHQLGVVEGVTVIRIAPAGFDAPYVLAAVRSDGLLSCGEFECAPDTLPAIGTVVRMVQDVSPRRFQLIKSRGRQSVPLTANAPSGDTA